jgi:hypothetical protein
MYKSLQKGGTSLIAGLLLATTPMWAAEPVGAVAAPNAAATRSGASEIEQLKQMLLDQQRQIDELRGQLSNREQAQQHPATPSDAVNSALIPLAADNTQTRRGIGEVASLSPILPSLAAVSAPSRPQAAPPKAASSPSNPCEAVGESAPPTFIHLGSTCIVPIGFMDLTAVWRDKNAGSSLGTNFGSVPYNTSVNAKNSEFRFTPQNSRIGFRVDGDWKGTHFIGYNEFDFLGTGGGTNYTVTNGAFVPRLRLFWADMRKGSWEFLAGQSWSMLTPNRKGISALPGDLFYSQVIDVNYMAGLTWTRQPGMRVLFHPNNKFTAGLSFENPDQYIGGSAGGSGITLPAALTGLASTQLDNAPNISVANTVLAVPTVHPDIIAKIAFDPSSRFHLDASGLLRTFKVFNPNTTGPGAQEHSTVTGGGFQLGVNAEVAKNFRLISTNYWSDGGGRYLFGQAPDLIVRANGALSLVHAGGTVDGFEATIKNWLLYAYYGGIYLGRNTALDANGTTPVGFGYSGSPNSQNRMINEFTFGFNQTIWRSPRYGAINAMGQYEYLSRNPWFVATGAPKAAHDNTIYFNLRYTLPGAMPNF